VLKWCVSYDSTKPSLLWLVSPSVCRWLVNCLKCQQAVLALCRCVNRCNVYFCLFSFLVKWYWRGSRQRWWWREPKCSLLSSEKKSKTWNKPWRKTWLWTDLVHGNMERHTYFNTRQLDGETWGLKWHPKHSQFLKKKLKYWLLSKQICNH